MMNKADGFSLLFAGPNLILCEAIELLFLLSSLNPVSFDIGFLEAGLGDFAEFLRNKGGGGR